MTSNQKGEIAVLKAQLAALEKGFIASRPLLPCRYDLVIDVGSDNTGSRLLRTQVKYADGISSKSSGVVVVALRRFSNDNKYNRKSIVANFYTGEQIDLLLVYVPKIDKMLAFKPGVFNGRPSLSIRIAPPKNGQKVNLLTASDFVW